MDKNYDVAVLGGGPGGYVAAIRAAQLGAKVALIEKDNVGGTCLNYGCIPTKAILACTNLYDKFKKAENYGISAQNVSIDLQKVIDRKNKIVSKLVKGIEQLLKSNKVELIEGIGTVLGPGKIEVIMKENRKLTVESRKLVLATGSTPISLPSIPFDHTKFLSSDDMLNMTEIPEKLDIVGGGVIGIEFANMFASLGTEVTIYEILPEILVGIDPDAVSLIKRILARKKVKFLTSTKFSPEMSCGKTLIAVGRKSRDNSIKVNNKMETSTKDVYAIGDLISSKMLAHVAIEQGIVAAENAMGGNRIFDYDATPYTIYTNPEIAGVGKGTGEGKGLGKFPYAALGIAQAHGEIEGFVKVITDSEKKIIGVHIIGEEANTLLGAATICVKNKFTIDQLKDTIQAHPSFPEGLQEAALSALKIGLHSIG